MRLLVLSDVHADARALERALRDAAGRGYDRVLFLGDAVGYGDEPAAAVARLRELPLVGGVQGNHEAMMFALLSGEPTPAAPRIVTMLAEHGRALDEDAIAFLRGLEPELEDRGWAAVHGAPRQRFEYLISVPLARANEPHMRRPLTFVGHTHVPSVYLKREGGSWRLQPVHAPGLRLRVPEGARAFVNPGSTAFPRDDRPGGSYAIWDDEARTVEIVRFAT